ncbi:MAG: extracellular solute-binding protein [Clostridiales bacterium]|nr:extracellular solute-binding protein [Clostridiales bacterium]
MKDTPSDTPKPSTPGQEEKKDDSDGKKDDDMPGGGKSYELQVAWWGGEQRNQKMLDMIDKYMDKYPNAKIISQYAPFTDYFTKLSTQAASQTLPDVYMLQLMYLGEYAAKGLAKPLQEFVDAGLIDISKFTPGALSSSSYEDKLVGITMGDTASVLCFNKTLIEKANYSLPTDQMTYGEFGEFLKGLAKELPEGHYAAGDLARHEFAIENFTRQHGKDGVVTKDGKELGYTKEILADYLKFHLDMYESGVYGPIEVIMEERGKQWADSLAGQGKIGCWFTNVNQGKIFQASIDDEVGMVRFPVADNATNKYVEAIVCSTWAISSTSKLPNEAAHFINEIVNNWELQEIYDMDIGVPGSTDIQNKLIEQLDPENNKIDRLKKREIELMQDILTSVEPFHGRPPGFSAVIDDLYAKADEVIYGRMTIEEAVDAHFSAAEMILKQ